MTNLRMMKINNKQKEWTDKCMKIQPSAGYS